ncbi:hypothetical protein P7F88_17760 [Vibrio hannami]|uniref:hypothetical protein n=1 Tax=Vibrio hannami TaxID=2717094 RepID=UPI00240FC205|nr:hypothetical protein [Vibrio hannami]MDG3087813.1 hypothetical protein [Vibrio hannami]
MQNVKDEGFTPLKISGVVIFVMFIELTVGEGALWLWIPTLILLIETVFLSYIVYWFRKTNGGES